ncbi:ATP-binding protein [Desulfallas thermosapovorans]|uniref:Stage 0 sporulation protein A homolog n=1 Tax=Desulfallas thermosapovorans DSM 6562 TaxID=1121431 RepID=A0A5S4ZRC5_9FIRM|nr:ATP-binding protein [Desulfallas thermosapovorans]TYO95277.1 GAF domain-containing protein [Desulfallas thermosapovorans DSM 6562]
MFAKNSETRLKIDEAVPESLMDVAKIKQLILNLAQNAMDAMGGSGILSIETRYIANRDEVRLDISDTGCGIPSDIIEKIGMPFFTTKAGGTGLGLSISYSFQDAYKSYYTNKPSVAFSIPVARLQEKSGLKPDYLGVLVCRVEIDAVIRPLLESSVNLGDTGEVILINNQGLAITELRDRPGSALSYKLRSEPAVRVLKGEEGYLTTTGYNGQEMFCVYRYLPNVKWGLIVRQETSELIGPVRKQVFEQLYIVMAVFACILVLVMITVNRFLKPVSSMAVMARDISRGDFSSRVTVLSNDELGMLGHTINTMAGSLDKLFKTQQNRNYLLQQLVSSTLDVEVRLRKGLASICEFFGFQVGAVFLMDEEKEILVRRAEYCPGYELMGKETIPLGDGLESLAVTTQQLQVLDEVPADATYTVNYLGGNILPGYIVAVPLLISGQTLGVMSLAALKKNSTMDIEELKVLGALIGMAVQQHLLHLIDGLLDLSKIEAGKMKLDIQKLDPAVALEEAVAMVSANLTRKQINLRNLVPRNQYYIYADKDKLKQVFLNLLTNAVKFTPNGGQIITGARLNGDFWELRVADNGIGIAREDHDIIFEEFKQGGNATREHGGTGLGLAISKKLIEMQGGRISVESEEGQGATFTIALPVAGKAMLLNNLPASVTFLTKPLDKDVFLECLKEVNDVITGKPLSSTAISVLVVDDDPAFRDYLATILAPFNYLLITAGDGMQGTELAMREKPDIMILDVAMPKMNGLQVLDKLSEHFWPKGMYVFIVTSQLLTSEDKQFITSRVELINKSYQ